MRLIRMALFCAGLLLASGCSGDRLPTGGDREAALGRWSTRAASGVGPGRTSSIQALSLNRDGTFAWARAELGDGAGNPDALRRHSTDLGDYRIRGGFLEIRTRSSERAEAPELERIERTVVQDPRWEKERYRIDVDGDLLTLRFTVAPADAPIDVTLLFNRDGFQ